MKYIWITAVFTIFLIWKSDGQVITNENTSYSGILLEESKPLELRCILTEPNEGFNIKWAKDGTNLTNGGEYIIVDSNFTLTVEKPVPGKHDGNYSCTFSNATTTFPASILVWSKAYVTPFSKSLNYVQGDTLSLKCLFGGFPKPTFQWYKDDKRLNDTDERVSISDDEEGSLTKGSSILKITDLVYDDAGTYKCEAENKFSDVVPASSSVTVKVKDKLAALWPFLGICAEVTIICIIIFIYEKRRVQPDFEENDDSEQKEDTKTAPDEKDGEQDVRQRK